MALSPFSKSAIDPAPESGANVGAGIAERFGILQPQEVVLGLFGEYVGQDERAWSGGLVHILGDLGFSSAAARVALNRVIARDLLAPEKEGRFVFYTITPRLRVVHDEGRHQTFSAEIDPQWSGHWTIAVYTVSDEERVRRSRLGRWLGLRGFGQLQEGVWIAPGNHESDVGSLAQRLDLEKQVVIFVGELARGLDLAQTIAKAWRVDDLKVLYDLFVEEFQPPADRLSQLETQPREAFVTRTRLIEMFRQTMAHDPRMPDSLVGLTWRRGEAIALFQRLEKALLPAASAYFRGRAITGDIGEQQLS